MPIVHMANSKSDTSFPTGAYSPVEWSGEKSCWTNGWSRDEPASAYGLVLYTTHHGLCLLEREVNGRDDSDFYMVVWDPEAQAPVEKFFATTRGWSYPCLGSSVDASAETLAEYEAWKARYQREVLSRIARQAALEAAAALQVAEKGALVRVRTGRKVKQGTTGFVLHVSEARDYVGKKVRNLLLSGGEIVEARHCEVVRPSKGQLQRAFDLAENYA